jgi:hypothetical protein
MVREYASIMNKDEVWKCKDGREILVKDMGDTHMRNCLRHLGRRGYDVPKEILSLTLFELQEAMRKQIRVLRKEQELFDGCDATEADIY